MTIRRLKTYTSSQGYVYQYYFVGQRPAQDVGGEEYLFDVTSDRKHIYSVSVVLPGQVVAEWNHAHGHVLSGAEQYAAVKLHLFRAFDEPVDMESERRQLRIDRSALKKALASLGIE